jgi:uncharacterized protein (TIGR01777 family)
MPTILITGGTGMIGTRLTELLADSGYEIIILTRGNSTDKPERKAVRYAHWDIEKQEIDTTAINKADCIIHLAGENVAEKRWTARRKLEIVDSRIQSSALIVKALAEIPNQVKTVVSASAMGWYGPDTVRSRHDGFTEDAPADKSYLGETCRLWEQSIQPVQALGKRLVILRTAIVLSALGGALNEYKKPLRLGIAPVMGGGKQIISWIQLDDLCRLYIHAIEKESMEGVYNAASPGFVSNKQFVLELGKQMRGKYYIPVHVPVLVLELMLGEMSIEVLKSATLSSAKIRSTGFDFLYPNISEAIHFSL